MTPRLPLLVIPLVLALAHGADTVPAVRGEPPAPPTAADASEADRLLEQFNGAKSVAKRGDGRIWWQAGDGPQAPAWKIRDIDGSGDPRLDTPIGLLPVARRLVTEDRLDVLALLPRLLEHAVAAGLKADQLRLLEGLITGPHLRSPERVVLPEGVLTKKDAPARPDGDVAALEKSVGAVLAALPATRLDEIGLKTLRDVLGRLHRRDADLKVDLDEVAPSFARRVVRSGWLKTLGIAPAAAAAVEDAVRAAERFAPVQLYAGTDSAGRELRLAEVKDAFGTGGWTLVTPERSAFAHLHQKPMYYWSTPDLHVVIRLPAGADPTASSIDPIEARLLHGNQPLVRWTREGGMTTTDAYRQILPAKPRKTGKESESVNDFLPPHLVLSGLSGDITGVVVAKGVLRPPADLSSKETERFFAQAAELLPDAAQLDLIGQYLFTYVYDSPDSRFPQLIGNREDKGDIHQTAEQTLGTVTGGMFRGDCDDLSELYQRIAERQGRTAHVISLPQHAALAWAERGDGGWHVFVLQTGPAVEFVAPELQAALGKAYKHFDDADAFDPNGLGLLLRFSGENTRSAWRLSYRIFSEPDYAKTMIDVQRDWQYQTYQRGIAKMEKMVKAEEAARGEGKADTANYRELSGLSSFTGQYAEAVRWHRLAYAATPVAEKLSRFYMRQEMISHLLDAGQIDAGKAEAEDVLERTLPGLRAELGPSAIQVGLELTAVLSGKGGGKLAPLAVRSLDLLLNQTVMPTPFSREPQSLPSQIEAVADWVRSGQFDRDAWKKSDRLNRVRRMMQQYVGTAMAAMSGQPDVRSALTEGGPVQVAARAVQRWLDDVAFNDVDEPGEVLLRYDSAGTYYRAVLGAEPFDRLLSGVAPPAKADGFDHTRRVGGLAQLPADLPWIACSVTYRCDRLFELFAREKPKPGDVAAKAAFRETIKGLGAQVAAAHAAAKRLGLDHPIYAHQAHIAAVVVAMITQDKPKLSALLDHVADMNDKRLRDDTAQWMGDVARFCDLDWYGQAIDLWREHLNYKPKWFWIAWRAALTGGPDAHPHALLVAERAAKEFADDPPFAEERDFMKKLFALAPVKPAAK